MILGVDVCMLQGHHIQRRGAVVTIGKLAEHFGDSLFATLPNLWAAVVQPLEVLPEKCPNGMQLILIKYLTFNFCLSSIVRTSDNKCNRCVTCSPSI